MGKNRSRQRFTDDERSKIIEVKRRLSLGDGLRLIPTSDYEVKMLEKAENERRSDNHVGKKENITENKNI